MRMLLLVGVVLMAACGGDNRIDAGPNSCGLSGGCDFVVSGAAECPDPQTNPNFCIRKCGGFECCWCEDDQPQVLFIDCVAGCNDASLPDAAIDDGGILDAGATLDDGGA